MAGEDALGLSDYFIKSMLLKLAKRLEQKTVEGSAGNGAVRIVLTGKQAVAGVRIAPGMTRDVINLEEIIKAAVSDALLKSHELIKNEARKLGGKLVPEDFFS